MPTIKIVPMPGVSFAPTETSWTPVLSGTGFQQTSNPATGNYIRIGNLVFLNMNVPFSNTSNFGTGQYSVTLPFQAARHTDVIGGSIHDTNTGAYYTIKGHVSSSLDKVSLWYISGTGADSLFDYNSPVLLENADLFHMSFVYEAVPLA